MAEVVVAGHPQQKRSKRVDIYYLHGSILVTSHSPSLYGRVRFLAIAWLTSPLLENGGSRGGYL